MLSPAQQELCAPLGGTCFGSAVGSGVVAGAVSPVRSVVGGVSCAHPFLTVLGAVALSPC